MTLPSTEFVRTLYKLYMQFPFPTVSAKRVQCIEGLLNKLGRRSDLLFIGRSRQLPQRHRDQQRWPARNIAADDEAARRGGGSSRVWVRDGGGLQAQAAVDRVCAAEGRRSPLQRVLCLGLQPRAYQGT